MPILSTPESLALMAGGTPAPDPDKQVPAVPAVPKEPEANLPDITLNVPAVQNAEPQPNLGGTSDKLNADVDAKLKDAGFNLADIEKQIKADGKISDELVAKIKEKVDPLYVDAHLARIKAELELAQIKAKDAEIQSKAEEQKVQEMNKYIFDAVKGEDNFKLMAGYLKQNLPADEINALNELLQSGDKAKVTLALSQAVTKYNTLRGRGKLMEGDTTLQAPTIEPMSKDEYQKLVGTEKYLTDASYRKSIDERRLRTLNADKAKFPPGMYWTRDASGLRRI